MPLDPAEIKLEFDLFLSQADLYGVDRLDDARQLCDIFLLDYLMDPDMHYAKDIEKHINKVKKDAERIHTRANSSRSKKRKPNTSAEKLFHSIPLENIYKPEQIIWENMNGDLITVEGCAGSGKTEFLKQINRTFKQLSIDSRLTPIKINGRDVRFFCSSLYIPDKEAYKGNSSTDIEEHYSIYAFEVSDTYRLQLINDYSNYLDGLNETDLKKLSRRELESVPIGPDEQIEKLIEKFRSKIQNLKYDSRMLKLDGMIGQPWGKGKHLFKGWELKEGKALVPDIPFNLPDEVKKAKNSYFVLLANMNNNVLDMEGIINPFEAEPFIRAYGWFNNKLRNIKKRPKKEQESFITDLLEGDIKYTPPNSEDEVQLLTPKGEDARFFAAGLVHKLYLDSKFLGMVITGTEPQKWDNATKKFIQIIYRRALPTEKGFKSYAAISREEQDRQFEILREYILRNFDIDPSSAEYGDILTSGEYDHISLFEDTNAVLRNFIPNISKLFILPLKPDSVSEESQTGQIHPYFDYTVQHTAADYPSTVLDAYLNWVRLVDWYDRDEKYLAPLRSEKHDKIAVDSSKRARSMDTLEKLGI